MVWEFRLHSWVVWVQLRLAWQFEGRGYRGRCWLYIHPAVREADSFFTSHGNSRVRRQPSCVHDSESATSSLAGPKLGGASASQHGVSTRSQDSAASAVACDGLAHVQRSSGSTSAYLGRLRTAPLATSAIPGPIFTTGTGPVGVFPRLARTHLPPSAFPFFLLKDSFLLAAYEGRVHPTAGPPSPPLDSSPFVQAKAAYASSRGTTSGPRCWIAAGHRRVLHGSLPGRSRPVLPAGWPRTVSRVRLVRGYVFGGPLSGVSVARQVSSRMPGCIPLPVRRVHPWTHLPSLRPRRLTLRPEVRHPGPAVGLQRVIVEFCTDRFQVVRVRSYLLVGLAQYLGYASSAVTSSGAH